MEANTRRLENNATSLMDNLSEPVEICNRTKTIVFSRLPRSYAEHTPPNSSTVDRHNKRSKQTQIYEKQTQTLIERHLHNTEIKKSMLDFANKYTLQIT